MLDIPNDLPLWEVRVSNPRGQHGYYFVMWATVATADDPPAAPRFLLYQPDDTRKRRKRHEDVFAFLNLDAGSRDALIAWIRRVFYRGSASYVEARWTPTTGKTVSTVHKAATDSLETLALVSQGRKLLGAPATGGRPRGSTRLSNAEFEQLYPETYERLLDAYNSEPFKYEVAEAMNMDVKTFDTYRDRCKLPFPPF